MVFETAMELSLGFGTLLVGLFGIYFLSRKDRVRHAIFSLFGIAVIAILFIRWGKDPEFWNLARIVILSVSGGVVGIAVVGLPFLAILRRRSSTEREVAKDG